MLFAPFSARRLVARAALLLSVAGTGAARPVTAQPSPVDRALGAGNWTEAVRLLDGAIAASPRDAVRYQQRGRALRELQQFDRSLADYTKAIAINPKLATAYAGRAVVHQQQNHVAASIADVDSARRLGMTDPQIDLVEGMARMLSDDGAKAWALFDRYVKATPSAAQGWYLRGRAAGMIGRDADAVKDFTAAIERRMTGADIYKFRAMARANSGDVKGACVDFSRASQLGDADATSMMARSCR